MATEVTVTGTVTLAGEPAVGQIIFAMPGPVYDAAGNEVAGQVAYRQVLTAGAFSIPLPASNDPLLVPAEWTYDVDIALSGNKHIRGAILVDIANALTGQEFAGTFEPGAGSADPALYVRRGGDIMTGPLTLAGAPTAALHAATKAYVDASIGPGSGVASVFGRTGAVVAATNDYSVAQINGLTTQLAAKADLVAGKLSTSQIPDLAISAYLGAAANQSAMLALVGQAGDWCVRTDLSTTWVITGADPTQLSSWTQLSYPTAPVTSVAGKAGAVLLVKGDVGLGNVDNTSDLDKPISTLTQAAINAKMTTATYDTDADGVVNAASQLRRTVYFQGGVTLGDPVYASGINGAQIMVNKAQASSPSSMPAIGLAAATYSGGATGEIITWGALGGMNTGSFSAGDLLYVAAAGGLTNVRPAHGQFVAYVMRAGGGDGVVGVAPQAPYNRIITLTDAATIATNAGQSDSFRVTLGGSRTLGNPTNARDDQMIRFEVIQDGTGGHTLALDSKFNDPNGYYTGVDTAIGKRSHIGVRYNATADKFDVLAFVKGY